MSWKIIALIVLFWVAYTGYDGMKGNKDLVDFNVDQIEKSAIGDNRYISISGGYTTGQFVYNYFKSDNQKATSVIFPLISKGKFESFLNNQSTNILINVLVKRSSGRFSEDCVKDTSCLNDVLKLQNDGSYKVSSTSLGGYLAFSFPGISMIPVVGILGNPIIHAGSLSGKVTPKIDSVGGMPVFGDATGLIDGDVTLSGSYVRLGLPFYLGPLYIEPSAGSQTLTLKGISKAYTIPDAQVAIGFSF